MRYSHCQFTAPSNEKYSLNSSLIFFATIIIIIIIITISFFKVDFYITFYNYKKPINVNFPRKLEEKSDTRRFCKYINVINQLTILFLCQYQTFNGEKYKRKRKCIYYITYNRQNKKYFYSSTTHDYYLKPTCCK